jgi:hypothetical protein
MPLFFNKRSFLKLILLIFPVLIILFVLFIRKYHLVTDETRGFYLMFVTYSLVTLELLGICYLFLSRFSFFKKIQIPVIFILLLGYLCIWIFGVPIWKEALIRGYWKNNTDEVTSIWYPGAYNIWDNKLEMEISLKNDTSFSNFEYRVDIKYPAESMVSFYAEKLKALGYAPLAGPAWNKEIYRGPMNSSLCVNQFFECWIKKNKTRKAIIIIEYYSQPSYPILSSHPAYPIMSEPSCKSEPDNASARVKIYSYPYKMSKISNRKSSPMWPKSLP